MADKTDEWTAREKLRDKGQFWTPPWVAQAMVAYASPDALGVYDPGVGRGAFARAAAAVAQATGRPLAFAGSEVDREVLTSQKQEDPNATWLSQVRREDFLARRRLPAGFSVVANPPYIRHHRLGAERKAQLRAMLAQDAPDLRLDGRAGLHVYFLIHALALLRPGDRLAFIVPADIAEGVFAPALWAWIGTRFALDAVWRFDAAATPFMGVDTNPLVLCLRAAPPQPTYVLGTVHQPDAEALKAWVASGFAVGQTPAWTAQRVDLAEALVRGVGRPPAPVTPGGCRLGDVARVVRGIATGDNDFFFLTAAQVHAHRLPVTTLVRAVGRTRDVKGAVLTPADLDALEAQGRPTWLLSLDREVPADHARAVNAYLAQGVAKGLPERALIAQRHPWYRMERRVAPPWLFAYLGRRDARFIRNAAGAVPLTGFLCVYAKQDDPAFVAALDRALQDPRTVANLAQVGKTYGGGAVKVEPRGLERLFLPEEVLVASGLKAWV